MTTYILNLTKKFTVPIPTELQSSQQFFKIDRLYRKESDDVENYDYEFELKDEFINSEDEDEKAYIIITGTSNRAWGYEKEVKIIYENECNGIMDIKTQFLDFLKNIQEYTSDAGDINITQQYYNSYLKCVCELKMDSFIWVEEDSLSIGCFEITVNDLKHKRKSSITFTDMKYSPDMSVFKLKKNITMQKIKNISLSGIFGLDIYYFMIEEKYITLGQFIGDKLYLYGWTFDTKVLDYDFNDARAMIKTTKTFTDFKNETSSIFKTIFENYTFIDKFSHFSKLFVSLRDNNKSPQTFIGESENDENEDHKD